MVQLNRLARASALSQLVALLLGLLLAGSTACVSVVDDEIQQTPEEAAEARRNLGIDHMTNGRVALGIREMRHALALNDQDPMTHLWLGQAYLLKGKMDEALEHSERGVELEPDNHEGRLNLSAIYIRVGDYNKAIAEAELLVDDPTFSTPWRALTNLGWAELKQGQLVPARKSLEEALEYRENYWPALLNLGILEQADHDPVGSLRYLQEVLDLDIGPGPQSEVHYRMAEAYVALGHRERALFHLQEAIELSPHGRWGRQSREYLLVLN